MLKIAKIVFLSVFVALFFHGCLMSTKVYTPTPFKAATIKSDEALVYFYRPDSFLSKHNQWQFVINNTEVVAPLLNNGYISKYLKPGKIQIVMKQAYYPYNTYDKLDLEIEKGRVYYIKAVPEVFDFSTMQLVSNEIGSSEIKSSEFFSSND